MRSSDPVSGLVPEGNKPKWAFGVYELRNGEHANVYAITVLYLTGKLPSGSVTQWNRLDGKHISDPDLDLVELIRSEKYDKYAR